MLEADDIAQIRALAVLEGLDPDRCEALARSRERSLGRARKSSAGAGQVRREYLTPTAPPPGSTEERVALVRAGKAAGLPTRAIARLMKTDEKTIRNLIHKSQ